jgi:plasmid maintenance system antidote protein VapI
MSITTAMWEIEKTIRHEKEALSKLQRLAAKNMRISASHYSDIENGHRNLTVELAVKADRAFGGIVA